MNKPKKIGILTYHSSINEGAILQAYALQEACRILFVDFSIEIIDIRSLNILKRDFFDCFSNMRSMRSVVGRLRRYQNLASFMKRHLFLSPDRYIGDDYAAGIKLINKQQYDIVIVGSDEVWKVGANKNRERGFPNVYWLDGVSAKIKAAYAATAHKTIYGQLPEEKRANITRALSNIEPIGVRDRLTYDLVVSATKSLCPGGRSIKFVTDPTFLYEFERVPTFKKILGKHGVTGDQYVCLICENKRISNIVCRYFKQKHVKVISIGYHNDNADVNLYELDPFEWVEAIRSSKFCVTDRFHGTVFSLKYNVPYMAVDHYKSYANYESKIKYLLRSLSREQTHLDLSNKTYEDIEIVNIIECLYGEHNNRQANEALDKAIAESKAFLLDIYRQATQPSFAGHS